MTGPVVITDSIKSQIVAGLMTGPNVQNTSKVIGSCSKEGSCFTLHDNRLPDLTGS